MIDLNDVLYKNEKTGSWHALEGELENMEGLELDGNRVPTVFPGKIKLREILDSREILDAHADYIIEQRIFL